MNLTEKVSLLHGYGPRAVPGGVGFVRGVKRLGIPPLVMANGPQGWGPWAGAKDSKTTCWPSGLTVAASFDTDLARQWGEAMGNEFFEKGTNVQLGPALCVIRIPTNGRAFEYLSGEDPHLGSMLAPAVIKGIQSKGIMANVKHFIANSQETNRHSINSVVDERTLHELYYPPFEAAVASGVASFMCAYNKINGDWACGSNQTLRTDLKGTFQFQGFVMSDWSVPSLFFYFIAHHPCLLTILLM